METVPGVDDPKQKVVRATQQLSYLGTALGLMPKVHHVPLTRESRHSLILICFWPETFLLLQSCKM